MGDPAEGAVSRRVAIVGAGVIGTSVALTFARSGYDVVLIDRPYKDLDAIRTAMRRHARLARLKGSDKVKVA